MSFGEGRVKDRNRFLCRIGLAVLLIALPALSQEPAGLLAPLRWRLIGPFRGGRSVTAVGVPGHPGRYYFGAVDGGIWKTTDAGNTWKPIFDSAPIASIGALAVAPSNPQIIYAGTGESDLRSDMSYGDGVWKSTDGGRSWRHIGLAGTRHIGAILVWPTDPNRVYVAALGDAYAANAERGVFETRDGGRTWQKILYHGPSTGAIALAFEPGHWQTIFAALWQTRRPPWNVYPPSNGPGSGLYRSRDGGQSWQRLTRGLPRAGLGRIGIAVAPSDPRRVYALVDARRGGLYRSDDGGDHFSLDDREARIWGRGWYFGGVTVDPQNANVVYIANTSTYRSRDGGKSFTAIKGAPGGDDYHSVWIAPHHPRRIILSSDQGVVISLNGGRTWSSWYNQPTAQLYHLAADHRFPFWVYGAQQDSGAIAVAAGSIYGKIGNRDWHPIGAGGESDMVLPDPLDPNILFGGGVTRYNQRTGEAANVSPLLGRPHAFRHDWTLPLAFSPANPHDLYFANQYLFLTADGGNTWRRISPDLTRSHPGVPPNLDSTTARDGWGGPRKGVIYSIAPSPLAAATVWVGTDDGNIQLTRDGGKSWRNVTPPALAAWSKVTEIAASHYSAATAYAAVDRHRLDDLAPYLYRTRDGGRSWQKITAGIPAGAYLNAITEDPRVPGLLYAGTELGVYVSFDAGNHWQSLQRNLPVSSVRELLVRGHALVAATHGRSIWVMDDIAPLRTLARRLRARRPSPAAEAAFLFSPAPAWRVRPGNEKGTPLPPETPAGAPAPNGAQLDYFLARAPAGPVTLSIRDASGRLVRRYSSAQRHHPVNPRALDIPMYWIHPAPALSAAAGMHRWVWDLHYAAPAPAGRFAFYAAFFGGGGPWALPGRYTVTLTAGGKKYRRPLVLKMDPRVHVSPAALARQFQLAMAVQTASARAGAMLKQARALAKRLAPSPAKPASTGAAAPSQAAARRLRAQLASLLGPAPARLGPDFSGEGGPAADFSSLSYTNGLLQQIEFAINSADRAPTAQQLAAWQRARRLLARNTAAWQAIVKRGLPALNAIRLRAGLPAITASAQP